MKLKLRLITLLPLSIGLSFLSCSNDDSPDPGCFQEENRRIVATLTNVSGSITNACFDNYTIEPDEKVTQNPTGLFSPCNLTSEFEVDEARIVFSGHIYESFETEDICADFFEIIKIEFVEP